MGAVIITRDKHDPLLPEPEEDKNAPADEQLGPMLMSCITSSTRKEIVNGKKVIEKMTALLSRLPAHRKLCEYTSCRWVQLPTEDFCQPSSRSLLSAMLMAMKPSFRMCGHRKSVCIRKGVKSAMDIVNDSSMAVAEMIRLLVKHGVDIHESNDNFLGCCADYPLFVAIHAGFGLCAIQELIKAGARIQHCYYDAFDVLLAHAHSANDANGVERAIVTLPILRCILWQGAYDSANWYRMTGLAGNDYPMKGAISACIYEELLLKIYPFILKAVQVHLLPDVAKIAVSYIHFTWCTNDVHHIGLRKRK